MILCICGHEKEAHNPDNTCWCDCLSYNPRTDQNSAKKLTLLSIERNKLEAKIEVLVSNLKDAQVYKELARSFNREHKTLRVERDKLKLRVLLLEGEVKNLSSRIKKALNRLNSMPML